VVFVETDDGDGRRERSGDHISRSLRALIASSPVASSDALTHAASAS
jgi:hypothetical protein